VLVLVLGVGSITSIGSVLLVMSIGGIDEEGMDIGMGS